MGKKAVIVLVLLGIIVLSGCAQQPPATPPTTPPPATPPTTPPTPPEPEPEITLNAEVPSTAQARRNIEVSGTASYDNGLSEVQVNFKGSGVDGINSVRVTDCAGAEDCPFPASQEYAEAGTYEIEVSAIASDYNSKSVSESITITEAEAQ